MTATRRPAVEGTLHAADATGHAENLVAAPKGGDAGARSFDNTGEIDSENCW